MKDEKKLNIDISDSVSQLQYGLKQFEVKKKRQKVFFRGKSFDFDGYREYTQDDDASFIDWRASSRSDRMLVKQYKEEEKLKILFVTDVGENMILGSKDKTKCEFASEIVLSLSYLFARMGHSVGNILFNDGIKYYSLPRGGMNNFYVFSDILSKPETYGGGSDIGVATDFVLKTFDSSISVVILVSDFLSLNKKNKHYMNLLSSRFETFALMIRDPLDKTLPNMKGEFILEDPRTGQQLIVEPRLARKSYEKRALKHEAFVKESFKSSSIDLLDLSTTDAWVPQLTNFVKERARNPVVS